MRWAMYRYNCIKLLRSPRTWIALCLSVGVNMGISLDYRGFCTGAALPANALESFIMGADYRLCAIFHPVNLCFMLSEAPFMDENAVYMAFRSGRRTWYWQCVLLVTTVCAAYYLLTALGSCLAMVTISYAPDIWSGPARLLADGRHFLNKGLRMSPYVLEAYSPLTAALVQLGLYSAYTLPLALLYFALTISIRRAYAFAITALLHSLMLIVHMDGLYAMYSPFTYLLVSNWVLSQLQFKAYFGGICFCGMLLALYAGARWTRSMDVHDQAILWLK